MKRYDFKKTVARQNGFVFIQINKLRKEFYSRKRYINISYYLKLQIPMYHRQFSRVISQNPDFVKKIAMAWKIIFILHVRNGYRKKLVILQFNKIL